MNQRAHEIVSMILIGIGFGAVGSVTIHWQVVLLASIVAQFALIGWQKFRQWRGHRPGLDVTI